MKNTLRSYGVAFLAIFCTVLIAAVSASAQNDVLARTSGQSSDNGKGSQTLSTGYIWNTSTQQPATFNISGNGVIGGNSSVGGALSVGGTISTPALDADVVNSAHGLYIGGGRVLHSTGSDNLFTGVRAGDSITSGLQNAFYGNDAGSSTTEGVQNAIFGDDAGKLNRTGSINAFFGVYSGYASEAASNNAFFGGYSGFHNLTGEGNSFIGTGAGLRNTAGSSNTFVGNYAGRLNTAGSRNTALGASAGVVDGVSDATAIGAGALADASNSVVLGRSMDTVKVPGTLVVSNLGTGGSTQVCVNGNNQLALCSSSIRYKNDVRDFRGGLDLVMKLRPVSFSWSGGGARDLGFVAEEVNKAEPLMSVTRADGSVEGVKYDRVTTVLVNAVKEQQAQIDRQKEQIRVLEAIFGSSTAATTCRP